MERYIVGWGETFNIEFDLKVDHWEEDERALCYEIVEFEDQHLYPGAYYCSNHPNQTEGSIAFESTKKEESKYGYVATKTYPVFKELHKVYHVQLKQFRQSHVSTKLKRFVKIDGKLVDDYEIEDQPISGEIFFWVRDVKRYGAHIYNLKVTE